MRPDSWELTLEIALLGAFFLVIAFPLAGLSISFQIVLLEYTSDIALTEAEAAFFQPRQYYLVFSILGVSMTTLVFIGCAVRLLVKRRTEISTVRWRPRW